MFIPHVIAGAPVVPNFWPAMNTTFGASGKPAHRVAIEQIAVNRLDADVVERALGARPTTSARRR